MLRTLLEERFHMKAHVETRNVDVFAVTLSNRDGEPGPGLRTSDDDCLGPYTDPPADTPKPACAFRLESNRVEAGAVTMPEVARLISRIPGFNPDRVIVDGTGMPGRYDVLLSIDIPGNVRTVSPRNDASSADGSFVAAAGLQERRPIAIREALQQQLGLKLEKAKLPIPTLIIERAKKPEED